MNGTALKFFAQGPELNNIALLTGVPYLPRGAFEASGDLHIDRGALFIDDTSLSVGALAGSASGRIGLGSEAGDFDFSLSIQGPDAGELAELEVLQHFSGEPFVIEGNLAHQEDQYTARDLKLTVEYREILDGTDALEDTTADRRVSVYGRWHVESATSVK
jgi:hypothetical protein